MDSLRCSIELKSLTDKGEFSGYGAVYGNVDRDGDVIEPGAFTESLARFHKSGGMPSMFWNHNTSEPVGDWLKVGEDSTGLLVEGKLWVNKGIARAEQAYMMFTGKGTKGLSVGFMSQAKAFDKKGVRRISKGDLLEISPTAMPINPRALVTNVKALDILTLRQGEDILRDAGFSNSDAKAFIVALKKGLTARDESLELESAIAKLTRSLGG